MVDVVGDSVVEHGVEGKPWQLVLGDAVADGGVAGGDDMEDEGDDAVFAVAASVREMSLPFLIE